MRETKKMRSVLLVLCALAVLLPWPVRGQDPMTVTVEYTKILPIDGLPLSLVHLNDRTVGAVFQPPTVYAMRARAKEATLIYVQGTAQRGIEIDTTKFTIDQNGISTPGTATNIKNFARGKNKLMMGDRVDGVLTFAKQVDLTTGFNVTYDRDMAAEFKFNANQIKAMSTPAN
jgi:hypothetical protein